MFLDRELRTRFDLLRPDHDAEVARRQLKQKEQHDRHSSTRQFSVGDLVMTKNYRTGPDWVPATVITRLRPLSYLLETEDKQLWRRHIDQVRSRAISPVSQQTAVPDTEPETSWKSPASGVPDVPQSEPRTDTRPAVPEPGQNPPRAVANDEIETPMSTSHKSSDSVVAPSQETN